MLPVRRVSIVRGARLVEFSPPTQGLSSLVGFSSSVFVCESRRTAHGLCPSGGAACSPGTSAGGPHSVPTVSPAPPPPPDTKTSPDAPGRAPHRPGMAPHPTGSYHTDGAHAPWLRRTAVGNQKAVAARQCRHYGHNTHQYYNRVVTPTSAACRLPSPSAFPATMAFLPGARRPDRPAPPHRCPRHSSRSPPTRADLPAAQRSAGGPQWQPVGTWGEAQRPNRHTVGGEHPPSRHHHRRRRQRSTLRTAGECR